MSTSAVLILAGIAFVAATYGVAAHFGHRNRRARRVTPVVMPPLDLPAPRPAEHRVTRPSAVTRTWPPLVAVDGHPSEATRPVTPYTPSAVESTGGRHRDVSDEDTQQLPAIRR